tara:strand:- start:3317 stop:4210 length:894 start_codon:yes stop_codon:yes gene_type:complete
MTALVLLDFYTFNDYIITQYPENYEYEGKVAYIPENKEISIQTLLELLLIYSANDAAYISAIAVSESVDEFLILMNNKAQTYGMSNTNFMNPDGMDEVNHYTSLNDLLKLSIKIIDSKEIISIVSKLNFVSNVTGKEKIYNNTNLLIKEGFLGIKTGWTDKAGLTFIGLNQNSNRDILTIVNKSKVDEKKYSHFSDTKLLYKTSIETFKNYKIISKNSVIFQIRNSKGTETTRAEKDWIEFINTNKISSVVFNDYVDSFITVTFSKYQYIYELNKSKNNVKWKFNPLKIFNINANQN